MTDSISTLRLLAKCGSMDLSALGPIADEMERLQRVLRSTLTAYAAMAGDRSLNTDPPDPVVLEAEAALLGAAVEPSEKRNQAEAASLGDVLPTPTPRGSLPNSLGSPSEKSSAEPIARPCAGCKAMQLPDGIIEHEDNCPVFWAMPTKEAQKSGEQA